LNVSYRLLRPLAVCVAALALTSCATLLGKRPDLTVAPSKPPASVCAALPERPRVPDDAALPAPVTAAEREGMAAYLTWLGELGDWGTVLAARLTDAQRGC